MLFVIFFLNLAYSRVVYLHSKHYFVNRLEDDNNNVRFNLCTENWKNNITKVVNNYAESDIFSRCLQEIYNNAQDSKLTLKEVLRFIDISLNKIIKLSFGANINDHRTINWIEKSSNNCPFWPQISDHPIPCSITSEKIIMWQKDGYSDELAFQWFLMVKQKIYDKLYYIVQNTRSCSMISPTTKEKLLYTRMERYLDTNTKNLWALLCQDIEITSINIEIGDLLKSNHEETNLDDVFSKNDIIIWPCYESIIANELASLCKSNYKKTNLNLRSDVEEAKDFLLYLKGSKLIRKTKEYLKSNNIDVYILYNGQYLDDNAFRYPCCNYDEIERVSIRWLDFI